MVETTTTPDILVAGVHDDVGPAVESNEPTADKMRSTAAVVSATDDDPKIDPFGFVGDRPPVVVASPSANSAPDPHAPDPAPDLLVPKNETATTETKVVPDPNLKFPTEFEEAGIAMGQLGCGFDEWLKNLTVTERAEYDAQLRYRSPEQKARDERLKKEIEVFNQKYAHLQKKSRRPASEKKRRRSAKSVELRKKPGKSGYMVFSDDVRDSVRERIRRDDISKHTTIMTEIGRMWNVQDKR